MHLLKLRHRSKLNYVSILTNAYSVKVRWPWLMGPDDCGIGVGCFEVVIKHLLVPWQGVMVAKKVKW